MSDIITGPGKYKTAGFTHPVRVKGGDDKLVFGYVADDAPCMAGLWEVETGKNLCPGNSVYDITGPWPPAPPARHECWEFVERAGIIGRFGSREAVEREFPGHAKHLRHMVELREGEVIMPPKATRQILCAMANCDDPDADYWQLVYRRALEARPR